MIVCLYNSIDYDPITYSDIRVYLQKLKISELEEYAIWLDNLPRIDGRKSYQYLANGCINFELDEDAIAFKLRFNI